MTDYYQILGVSPNADFDEIRRRYRFLAKAYHPDRFEDLDNKDEAKREMQRINEAYAILSNSKKRYAYDREKADQINSFAYKQQDDAVDEYMQKMECYFEGLISKWNKVTNQAIESNEVNQILGRIIDKYAALLDRIYLSPEKELTESIIEEINNRLALLILMNISLGAEITANGAPPEYSLAEMQIYTCVPFYEMVSHLIKIAGTKTPKKAEEIEQNWNYLVEHSLSLCSICLTIGHIRAKAYIAQQTKPSDWAAGSQINGNESGSAGQYIDYCQVCGRITPTEKLTFYQNIGALVIRFSRSIKGNICVACAEHFFWRFTGMTLIFGWWGVISFFLTPLILISNLWNYIRAWKLRTHSEDLNSIEMGWKVAVIAVIAIIGYYLFTSRTSSYVSSDHNHQNISGKDVPISIPVKNTNPALTLKDTPGPLAKFVLTATLNPTLYSIVSESRITPERKCKFWNEISDKDQGKKMCVQGIVRDAYFGDDIFYITFSRDTDAFRLIVLKGYYFDVKRGNCVWAEGVVKTYGNMPYIEVGEYLYDCANLP